MLIKHQDLPFFFTIFQIKCIILLRKNRYFNIIKIFIIVFLLCELSTEYGIISK